MARLLRLEHRHVGLDFPEIRQRVEADREAGWKLFVGRYSRTVYTIALRLCRGEVEREESAQEVYAGVFERLARNGCRLLLDFRGDARFETYLFSAVCNELHELRRRRARERDRVAPYADEEGEAPLATDGFAEAIGLDSRRVSELVDQSLARLEPRERMVLRLRFRHGLPLRRLAEVFDWKDTNAAAYDVYRILRKLDLLARCKGTLRWGEPEKEVMRQCLRRWLADDAVTTDGAGGAAGWGSRDEL